MSTYLEHPSLVSRWQSGGFVVFEDAQQEDCTVWFAFDTSGGGEGRWEGLLGRRLTPDRARLCAIPLFVEGVNLGDEVSVVESGEGATVAVDVVASGGNRTFRVHFTENDAAGEDDRWQQLMIALEPFGCWFDVYDSRRIALSVDDARMDEVAEYLRGRETRGDLVYKLVSFC